MFKKEEASRIREEFWTTFGRYMRPIPSAEGLLINWVNYHTRVKDVYFRMDAGQKSTTIAITLEHRDASIRSLYYEQFLELKMLLEQELGEEWIWEPEVTIGDKTISRIYTTLPNVSVFNRDQWPDIISFLKPRVIALDTFWETARYQFDALK